MADLRPGVVSVVLVNFRGTDDTLAAIEGLGAIEWPADRLEIIVVENGSGDDSFERLTAAGTAAHIVRAPGNLGFAGGSNFGVRHSTGEYVAFLNNDARPDPGWIAAAVEAFESSPRIGAVASRVLDWDGDLVDFVDAGLTWYGMGYKPYTGEKPPPSESLARDVLFGTGSAMFVRRAAFDALGGFDEGYFMFFEDVDLGWRLNLAGWRYRYQPKSLAFHRHHASMSKLGAFKESYLLERNALFTLYKNVGDAALAQRLPAALLLAARRGVDKAGIDSTALEIRAGGSDQPTADGVSKEALAVLSAMDQFVEHLPELTAQRDAIQASRVLADHEIGRLFAHTDVPGYTGKNYLEGYVNITEAFDVADGIAATKVLIITGDPIGARMAGPAIRAWNMASILSAEFEVTLLSTTQVEDVEAPFDVVAVHPGMDREFAPFERWADVIVFQGHALEFFEVLERTTKILVADIYDPMHLEQLEQAREFSTELWNARVSDATMTLNQQLGRADFFLCASERQRLFYLGQLSALGRLNPATYAKDPDFRGLLDVAPFGLAATPPRHERDVLKGQVEGIGPDDKVLIWSGGLYNWFDPQTLVRAMSILVRTRPEAKLFFQGVQHPHPGVPEMAIVAETKHLATSLGILGTSVIINPSWVDYADRQNYLIEANAGVSTHHDHIETTFSFRTRILDYLWAGLPMVVTDGDFFADIIRERGLGIVVPDRDAEALADALEKVLYDEAFIASARAAIAEAREEFTWERVLQPLVEFVRAPHHAADRAVGAPGRERPLAAGRRKRPRPGLRHDVARLRHYLANGGVIVVLRKVRRRLQR